jgi:uncharacterized protein (TIGR03437 family)
MKIRAAALSCFSLACFSYLAAPLMAQIQIGGGTCSSASLNGVYSLSLTGRDVSSTATFSKILEGVGTVTFDGQSKVVFSLTNNTNQSSGVVQTWSGTYSLQADCMGTLTLTVGETASFSVESYNNSGATGAISKDYLITGQDGTYTFTGSGSLMPAAPCSASQLSGSYSFNGPGTALTAGAISGANNISGLLQFDGKGNVTANWNVAASGTSTTTSATGQYAVSPSCTGSATVTDSSGNVSTLQFVVTTSNGSNFLMSGINPLLMFTGSGRTESATAPCSVSTLTGVYSLVVTGRNISSSGVLTGSLQSTGSAKFDGAGNVVFSLTANTNLMLGLPETLGGTYTLASNCGGTLNITNGNSASFNLIAYNKGQSFAITGSAAASPLNYPLTGSGSVQPVSCTAGSISGTYAFSGTGNGSTMVMGSSSISSVNDISGLLQFDGRGNVTGSWSIATSQSPTADTVMGQYSVTSACLGSATVTDPSGSSWTIDFTVSSADGANFGVDIANLMSEFSASGHSTFTYPGLAVVNGASGVAAGTPPGSIFALYGGGLATGSAQATRVPLPTTLLTTTVTVNGEAAPLFYVSPTQINAQMPLDIQPGVASVVVKSGSASSNTVAVTVPSSAVPGIALQYPTNQGVVVNQNQSENTPAAPAHVGDTVVAYFTGGGPVQAAGPLVTGGASPNGLSPVLGIVQVTVGGNMSPSVTYTGLTPTLVGVYQVNFVIPQVSAGEHNLILTINAVPSAVTTISIAN